MKSTRREPRFNFALVALLNDRDADRDAVLANRMP